MNNKKITLLLTGILVLAFVVRIVYLDRHNFINDEVLNASRAIDWFDFFESERQTTPVQWFETRQWWQPLSFHDHPPFGFALQFVFSRVLGDSVWALRFPFVFVGVLSVYAIFLLMRELTGRVEPGLVAALLLSLHPGAVWISRLALYDGLIVCFIILSWFFFLRALKRPRYFLAWGAMVGLALLTKYTFIFMLPFFGVYMLYKRAVFKEKSWWVGFAFMLVILAPVIIYNIMLFKTRGHFDAALSSMLGMKPSDYVLIAERVQGVALTNVLNLWESFALPFFSGMTMTILVAAGFLYAFVRACIGPRRFVPIMLLIQALFVHVYFLFLEPERRFFTIVIPLSVVFIAYALYEISQSARAWYIQKKQGTQVRYLSYVPAVVMLVLVAVLFFEVRPLYSVPTYGYNELYVRVADIFRGAVSPFHFSEWKDSQVIEFQKKFQKRPAGFGWEKAHDNTAFILVDNRLDWVPRYWLSRRYYVNHLLTIFDVAMAVDVLAPQGITPASFVTYGFDAFYFIEDLGEADDTSRPELVEPFYILLDEVSKHPLVQSIETDVIKNAQGDPALKIHVIRL